MLLLGIILTLLGFILFLWVTNSSGASPINKPLAFDNKIFVFTVNILWIIFSFIGFYNLWEENKAIVFVITVAYIISWVIISSKIENLR